RRRAAGTRQARPGGRIGRRADEFTELRGRRFARMSSADRRAVTRRLAVKEESSRAACALREVAEAPMQLVEARHAADRLRQAERRRESPQRRRASPATIRGATPAVGPPRMIAAGVLG